MAHTFFAGQADYRRRFSNATFKVFPELPGVKSTSAELRDAVGHANQFCGRKDSGPELGTSADLGCQVSKFHKADPGCESFDNLGSLQINKAVFASAMCHLPPGRICTVPRESWWRTGCAAVVAGRPTVALRRLFPKLFFYVFLFCTRSPPSPTSSSTYTENISRNIV